MIGLLPELSLLNLLEFGSFLAMLEAAFVASYVVFTSRGANRPLLALSVLLASMLLTHSFYHLFSFLGSRVQELVLEQLSAALAVVLGIAYIYVWGRR